MLSNRYFVCLFFVYFIVLALTVIFHVAKATNEWFRIYKIPSGKPVNQFAFEGKAKDKVIHSCRGGDAIFSLYV